jgi:hypothetical protein
MNTWIVRHGNSVCTFHTSYHAEQYARALTLNQTLYTIERPMSALVDSVQPFKVRASCGHIEVRKMREATAGVPYTPETVLEAPNGRACHECEKPHASDCAKWCGESCNCVLGKGY